MKRFSILVLSLALAFLITSSGIARELKLKNSLKTIHSHFNTEELFLKLMVDDDLNKFAIEEEVYIDDIPFDTELVYSQIMLLESLDQFAIADEEYIDDIPFDTEEIAMNINAGINYDKALAMNFSLEEETYVDDIPFDTYDVVASLELNSTNAELLAKENKTVVEEAAIASSFEIRDILIPVIVVLGIMSYLFYAYVT